MKYTQQLYPQLKQHNTKTTKTM